MSDFLTSVQTCCAGFRDKVGTGFSRMMSSNDEVEVDESWKEKDDESGTRVVLHVYNVQKTLGGLNKGLRSLVGGGAFHGGVVVYFKEYDPVEFSFGSAPEGETGVFFVEPKGVHPDPFDFKEAIEMGHTKLTHEEILKLVDELQDMKGEWTGPSYNVVRHNCCHFSEMFLTRLGAPRPFPKWVNKMAKLGTKIEDKAHAAFQKAHHVEEKLKKKAHRLANYLFGRKDDDDNDGDDGDDDDDDAKVEEEPPPPPADDDTADGDAVDGKPVKDNTPAITPTVAVDDVTLDEADDDAM